MIDIAIEHQFPELVGGFVLKVDFAMTDRKVCFFGPSGSGKTLTMQAVAGLFKPGRGSIRIKGRTVFDREAGICLPARIRRLGYLFQDYALFPHLTVRENVAFGLGSGRACSQSCRRVESMLETFEIGHLAKQYPGCISGGQKQRVALARALAPRPEILLLDEPFCALDPLMRDRMRAQCLDLLARFETPTIIITHDPVDVAVFAEQVVLFEQGMARRSVAAARLRQPLDAEDELLRCLAIAVRAHEAARSALAKDAF